MPNLTEPPPGQTLVYVRHGADGRPIGATATARINHPKEHVWALITDVERYAGRVPMIDRVKRVGERVTIDLKFKVSLISVGFQFVVDAKHQAPDWLQLAWVAGEPRGLSLRFDLEAMPDGKSCLVRSDAAFEVQSLGWLAKYFLKNHPEIEMGIFPGVAVSLVDAMRRAADAP